MEESSGGIRTKVLARGRAADSLLRWYVSALVYRFSYLQIAHQVDTDLFAFLGDRLQGAAVLDCGCGPGIVAEKLVRAGAGWVTAIDVNRAMLAQTRRRLAAACTAGRAAVVQAEFSPQLFQTLILDGRGGRLWDLILFKRSLYLQPEKAALILRAAAHTLAPGGALVVIHPERCLSRYAFGPEGQVRSYTPLHLFNRCLSLSAQRLGLGLYTLYTLPELQDLLRQAHSGLKVEVISTRQMAYHLVAATRLAQPVNPQEAVNWREF